MTITWISNKNNWNIKWRLIPSSLDLDTSFPHIVCHAAELVAKATFAISSDKHNLNWNPEIARSHTARYLQLALLSQVSDCKVLYLIQIHSGT